MKIATTKIVFNCNGLKLKENDKGAIHIEVYFKGKRKRYSTGLKVASKQWSGTRIVGNSNQIEMNQRLTTQFNQIEKFCLDKGESFSFDQLDNFLSKGGSDYTFIQFMKDQIEKKTFELSTKKHHLSMVHHVEDYGKIIYFSDVNFFNVKDFDYWLRTNPKNKEKELRTNATVYAIIKRLRHYVKQAIIEEYIKADDNPFLRLKIENGRHADRRFLTPEELEKIENKTDFHPVIEKIRDIFIFQCYTGLSYMDLENLDYSMISKDKTGNLFIRINRGKTDEKTMVMILPKAKKILDKYKGGLKCLPVPANQTYNDFLKEIAVICGIEKNLTTHVARHTFATTIMLTHGVSLETTSKALGHASVKTTQIYAKILEKRIADEMGILAEKLK